MALAPTELIWLQSLLKELEVRVEPVPVLWCDNMEAISLASNPVFHARTKHIEIDVHFIREKILSKEVEVRFASSEEQVADVFTRALNTPSFEYLRDKPILDKSKFSLRNGVKELVRVC